MTKKASFTPVTDIYNNASVINSALNSINNKLDNTISRDGSTPNQMEADLDLNNNNLLNVKTVNTNVLKVAGVKLTSATATPLWRGNWVTATDYIVNDIIHFKGSSYICVEAHTSSVFASDLFSGYWEVFAEQGATGDGTGDMLASNNLSDLENLTTARANLGLGTAAFTASTAYATAGQGLLADTALQPADVLDEDTFTTNSPTLPPSQQSTKAYVDAAVANLGFTDLGLTSLSGEGFVEITGLPSTVKQIRISILDASLTGSDNILVQLITTGLITSGYTSSSTIIGRSNVTSTSGHVIDSGNSTRIEFGEINLYKYSSIAWRSEHKLHESVENFVVLGSGKVVGLADAVTGFRFTRTGTNTFTDGTIKVEYT